MTAVRLLLIYPYVQFLLHGDRVSAALTFIVALVTDVDGTVARTIHATSKFGSLFDPIVDFLFALTALGLLVQVHAIPLWAVAAYFASVVMKFTYMQHYFRRNRHVKNSFVSKLVAQGAAGAIIFGSLGLHQFIAAAFLLIATTGNVILTLYWFSRR